MRFSLKVLSVILVVAVSILVALLAREVGRIREIQPTSWQEDHRADCAVVLTGGPHRAREGLDLLAQKNVKKLVITGTNPNANLYEIFPEWPFYGDISTTDVILEKHSQTTYGNAQQALALVEAIGCHDIVLVTSRTHMYRAYRTFRAVFPKRYPIYQRAVVGESYSVSFWGALDEAIKSLFYRILWLV